METGVGVFLGLVVAAGLGVGGYALLTKDKENSSELELRNQQLQLQLQQQQFATYQAQQAPVAAQPTQQGQTAAGGVASVVDGIFQLGSLLFGH